MSTFKVFDQNAQNMLSNQAYDTSSQRINGVQTGVASSQLQNRQAHQSSYMSVALATFMEQNGYQADDDTQIDQFVNDYSQSLSKYLNTETSPPKFITDALGIAEGSSLNDTLFALARVPANVFIVIIKLTYPSGFNPVTDATYAGFKSLNQTGGPTYENFKFNSSGTCVCVVYNQTLVRDRIYTAEIYFDVIAGYTYLPFRPILTFVPGGIAIQEIFVSGGSISEYDYTETSSITFPATVKSIDVLVVGAGGRGGPGGMGGGFSSTTGSGSLMYFTGAQGGGGGGGGGGTGEVFSQMKIPITPLTSYAISVGSNGGYSSAFNITAMGGANGANGTTIEVSSPRYTQYYATLEPGPSAGILGGAGGAGGIGTGTSLSGGAGGTGGTGGVTGTKVYSAPGTFSKIGESGNLGGAGGAGSSKTYQYWGNKSLVVSSGSGGGGGAGGGGSSAIEFIGSFSSYGQKGVNGSRVVGGPAVTLSYSVNAPEGQYSCTVISSPAASGGAGGSGALNKGGDSYQGSCYAVSALQSATETYQSGLNNIYYSGQGQNGSGGGTIANAGSGGYGGGGGGGHSSLIGISKGNSSFSQSSAGQAQATKGLVRIRLNYT